MTNEERLAKIAALNAEQAKAEADQIKELNSIIDSADIKHVARDLVAQSRPSEPAHRAANNLLAAINNVESVAALYLEPTDTAESDLLPT